MTLKASLSQKFAGIPAWGWVGMIGAGGAVVVIARRRAAAAKAPAGDSLGIDAYGPAPRGSGAGGGADGGGGYGAGDGGSSSLQSVLDAIAALGKTTTTQPTTATPQPLAAPKQLAAPAALSPLDLSKLGTVVGQSTVTNPVSSLQKTAYYTPSPLDIASTLPGGITSSLFVPSGASAAQGQYSDIYTNFAGGTGPVVAPSAMIPGERYDAYGRVIL